MMRIRLGAAVALLAAASLTACTSDPEPVPDWHDGPAPSVKPSVSPGGPGVSASEAVADPGAAGGRQVLSKGSGKLAGAIGDELDVPSGVDAVTLVFTCNGSDQVNMTLGAETTLTYACGSAPLRKAVPIKDGEATFAGDPALGSGGDYAYTWVAG